MILKHEAAEIHYQPLSSWLLVFNWRHNVRGVDCYRFSDRGAWAKVYFWSLMKYFVYILTQVPQKYCANVNDWSRILTSQMGYNSCLLFLLAHAQLHLSRGMLKPHTRELHETHSLVIKDRILWSETNIRLYTPFEKQNLSGFWA